MPRKRDTRINYINEHTPFLSKREEKAEIGGFEKGAIIRFEYDKKIRHVFVVHPMWEGKVHGLDLKQIHRKHLLIVANAPSDLTEYQLYDKFISGNKEVKESDAYRCYIPKKMTGIRTIVYDSSLQGTEKGEPLIEEPPQLPEAVSEKTKIRQMLQDELTKLREQELDNLL